MTTPVRIAEIVTYPAVMALGFASHAVLQDLGLSLAAATYLAVAAAALAILVYERLLPYRDAWSAGRGEIVNDTLYLGLVQMLLPKLLGFAALLGAVRLAAVAPAGLWPHDWPVVIQAVLMLLAADFLRYWLHRAAHKWPPLWRLHAVHHAPKLLYWLNVGRFHPIEKALQYLFDALPFVLLGVAEPVLAVYFVFYAINGFFQHSNCRVRLGPLNYLISGPELHRWHHSRLPRESNSNYGNNLIVWDLLFGTRFLPEDRAVGELGLLNRDYPADFVRQLATPFVKGLDRA